MIDYDKIREIHLEISSFCNAICPQCPRNFNGYTHNDGYPEVNMTLEQAKKIFAPDLLKRLNKVLVNGNFGDMVMNPNTIDIFRYFKSENRNLRVVVSTNGGARNINFWKSLAEVKPIVYFCIDGLEDTHHLYRQNTVWKTVIKNAKTFIDAGGIAVWKMIKFKHNQHQIEDCRLMSKELGFKYFELIDHGRDTGPVFDKNGQFTHALGDYDGPKEFDIVFYRDRSEPHVADTYKEPENFIGYNCETKDRSSVYVAANGDVTPCCYTGFYPKTFGHNNWAQAINGQLVKLARENNALEYPFEHCIEWFVEVEKAWKHSTYREGRLLVCDTCCSK